MWNLTPRLYIQRRITMKKKVVPLTMEAVAATTKASALLMEQAAKLEDQARIIRQALLRDGNVAVACQHWGYVKRMVVEPTHLAVTELLKKEG
jgi:hypothetical protein